MVSRANREDRSPLGDFIINAQRLGKRFKESPGKQHIEAVQILDAIQKSTKWVNHPIVKAWRPFIDALKYYINCVIQEWIHRGGENNIPLFEIPPFFYTMVVSMGSFTSESSGNVNA